MAGGGAKREDELTREGCLLRPIANQRRQGSVLPKILVFKSGHAGCAKRKEADAAHACAEENASC